MKKELNDKEEANYCRYSFFCCFKCRLCRNVNLVKKCSSQGIEQSMARRKNVRKQAANNSNRPPTPLPRDPLTDPTSSSNPNTSSSKTKTSSSQNGETQNKNRQQTKPSSSSNATESSRVQTSSSSSGRARRARSPSVEVSTRREQQPNEERQRNVTRRPRKRSVKKRRNNVYREIRRLQAQHKKFQIPLRSFQRLVREILMERSMDLGMRVTGTMLEALQASAELYLELIFSDSYLLSYHRGRVTLTDRDLKLLLCLRRNFERN